MNKKKILSVFLCTLVVSSLFAICFNGYADDIDKNGAYAYTSSNATLTIYNDSIMVDKTEQTMAEYPWYSYKSAIEHIIIADGVTKISDYAFCREDNLIDVVIPESVTSIGTAAFAGTESMKEITISDNVTTIGTSAFGLNSSMEIMPDFQCNCSSSSYAQNWCIQNYIPFNTPFSVTGSETAHIENQGQQYFWSFVPKTDCTVTFYSSCNFDTVGLIYDADNYIYSPNYSIMKGSAIAFSDDIGGSDVNFKIVTELKANKRYYLATRFKLSNKTGNINVNFEYECVKHIFNPTELTEDFVAGTKDLVTVECINCGEIDCISFSDAVIEQYDFCDINRDGVVNAKDYAMMLKGQFNK